MDAAIVEFDNVPAINLQGRRSALVARLRDTFGMTLTGEQELLLLLLRNPGGAAEPEIARGLVRELNWETFFALAHRHRVSPLVYRNLQNLGAAVPDRRMKELAGHYHASVRNSILLCMELVRLGRAFREARIPVIPFKGPLLASLLYRDLGVRVYSDIDVLIRREDFERAKTALAGMGYHSTLDDPEEERKRLDTQMGFEFVHKEEGYLIEVHWQFLHSIHKFDLDPDEVWKRAMEVNFNGSQFVSLTYEDMLLYLCAHGAKHYWENLNWVCDIAHFLQSERIELDWQQLERRAASINGRHILYLGLNLARVFFEAKLPSRLERAIEASPAVQRLTGQVVEWTFTSMPKARLDSAHRRFHLEMRERFIDRLPYHIHLVRLAVKPTENDLNFVSLPGGLGFLYYAVRPLRLVCDFLRRRFVR